MKKFLLIPLFLSAVLAAAQVKTIKIPPNKDTVLVTSTTTTTVIPAQVTTATTITATTIPTNPGPNPGPGGEVALSFSPETNFYPRPFAGPENWNGQYYSPIPASGSVPPLDLYFRFLWTQLEGPTQGSYSWAVFDKWINQAIGAGQRFSFGIWLMCPGGCDPFNGPVSYDGASSGYPLYLHQQFQSEAVKDRILGLDGSRTWVPPWNSTNLNSRMRALLFAVRDHINTGSFNGIQYKNVVNYIDIRFMGSWGEWHHAGIVNNMSEYPAGMRPVTATYINFINNHRDAFPDNQLVMLLAALDAERLNHTLTPIEVTNYALTVKNNVGLLGIRSDQRGSLQWRDQGNYVRQYMENNNKSFQGGPVFSSLTMTRWQFAPLVGEPENNSDNPNLQTLVDQFRFYGQNSIGNGNYKRSAAADNSMRSAADLAGYRLGPTGGKIVYNSTGIFVTLFWQNTGLTPVYEFWNPTIEVVNQSGTVVRTIVSKFVPRLFIPAPIPVSFTDTLSAVPSGSYSVRLIVRDPRGYRQPFPLNVKGRNPDGSYTLASFSLGVGITATGNPN